MKEDEEPLIRSATTYVLSGGLSDEELSIIKKHCINPVDSRETTEEKPKSLSETYPEPSDVLILKDFISKSDDSLRELYSSLSLAMTFSDFLFIRDHFRDEEKRDPSITEIRVLDTYWSDHCRHTTFSTELKDIEIPMAITKSR